MRWLHKEASDASSHAEGHKACTGKEETPAGDFTHVRVGHVARDEEGAEHAEKERTLNPAEDLATTIVGGEIRDETAQEREEERKRHEEKASKVRVHLRPTRSTPGPGPVADRSQRGQKEAAHAAQEDHDKEVGDEGKDGDREALAQCADEQDVLLLHGSAIGQDSPEGCCEVGEHHLHRCQDGEVPKAESKISLQRELARWDELGVQALQGADAAKPEKDNATGLPLIGRFGCLLGLHGGLLGVVGLRVVHHSIAVLGRAGGSSHRGQVGHRVEAEMS